MNRATQGNDLAKADYRLCDVCNGKAFYDANLNYEWLVKDGKHTMELDSLGDWAVICARCAKTHKCVVVNLEDKPNGDNREP